MHFVDYLYKNTNAVAEKYKDPSGKFDYNAALAPHATNMSAEFNAVRFTLKGDEDDKSADNLTLNQRAKGIRQLESIMLLWSRCTTRDDMP